MRVPGFPRNSSPYVVGTCQQVQTRERDFKKNEEEEEEKLMHALTLNSNSLCLREGGGWRRPD